jgi:hypothetical protein
VARYYYPMEFHDFEFLIFIGSPSIMANSRSCAILDIPDKGSLASESRIANFLAYWTIVWRHVITAFSQGANKRWRRLFLRLFVGNITIRERKRPAACCYRPSSVAVTMRARQCTLNIFMVLALKADALLLNQPSWLRLSETIFSCIDYIVQMRHNNVSKKFSGTF